MPQDYVRFVNGMAICEFPANVAFVEIDGDAIPLKLHTFLEGIDDLLEGDILICRKL